MNQNQFLAQDAAGNRCRVRLLEATDRGAVGQSGPRDAPAYVLEDGSAVKRVDADTFQVLATGAYITLLRD